MRCCVALACVLAPVVALASPGAGAPHMVLLDVDAVDAFPLKDHRVDVQVTGVIAQVHVTQTYENRGTTTLHASYVFPSGTRAAVHALKMTVGTRTTRAVLREREDAARAFAKAVEEGRTAGLLEQQRPNVLKMQVGNVLPRDVVTVELDYSELLVPTDATYELVIPAVVGPRYESHQDPSPVPGNPPRTLPPGHSYDLAVRIASALPVVEVRSSSHHIGTTTLPDQSVQVVLDGAEPHPGNRDFVLRYRQSDRSIQAGVLVHPSETSTLLAMVEPPLRPTNQDIPSREYIFLVDVSGSMQGTPLKTTQGLLEQLTAALRPEDRFNVVLFESMPFVMHPQSVPASRDAVKSARHALLGTRGGGGTQMLAGLQTALDLPHAPGMSRTVLLITDGYVNVEQRAFQLVRSHLSDMNLFAFGIGQSVNRHLVEGLARAGGGEPFIVEGDNAAAPVATQFWEYVRAPVLTGVKVRFEGVDVSDVIPAQVPDLFASRPLTVMAHFKGQPRGEMVVTGISGQRPVELRVPIVARNGETHPALPLLWARHRLEELSDPGDDGTPVNNRAAITQLALQHGLLSAYTSFLAVDDRVAVPGPGVPVEQPLAVPEGMEAPQPEWMESGTLASARSASMPAIQAGRPVLMGSLDHHTIGRIIKSHVDQVRGCYQHALLKDATLHGRMVVRFMVGEDGVVRSAVVDQSDMESPELETCLATRVKTWVFPKVQGGGVITVNYPFVFASPESK